MQVPYAIDDLDDDEPERALLIGVGEANRGRKQGVTYSLDDSLLELGGLAEAAGLKVGISALLVHYNSCRASTHVQYVLGGKFEDQRPYRLLGG